MTNLQQLESRIRELVPSLQKLSFGCNVEVDGVREDNPGCEYDVVVDERMTGCGVVTLGYFGGVDIRSVKVIGHPIQLHHVLQAIQLHYGFNDLMYYAGMRGDATVQLLKICGAGKECDWNLTHPLSGQSEKTIKFLLEILK